MCFFYDLNIVFAFAVSCQIGGGFFLRFLLCFNEMHPFLVDGSKLLGYNVVIGGGMGMTHGNTKTVGVAMRGKHIVWFWLLFSSYFVTKLTNM